MSRLRRQGGVAAMEFALILPIMILLLWGVVSFGSIFFAQLAISSAASDGARAAVSLRNAEEHEVRGFVLDTLRSAGVIGAEAEGVTISFPAGPCSAGPCVRVRVEANYASLRGTPILSAITLPLVGAVSWLPDTLAAEATALLP